MFSGPEGQAVGPAQTYPNPRDTGKGSKGPLDVATSLHATFEECQDRLYVKWIPPHDKVCPREQLGGIRCKHNL
jgi:hypothetical protein